MEIKNAKYEKNESGENCAINCEAESVNISVPLVASNRHYAEILKQVKEGTLTIKDAD